MTLVSTWPRAALIAVGVLLLLAILGWGLAIERSSRASTQEEALAAAGERIQALEQQAGQLEATLATERRAMGDLAAINTRLQAMRAELATAEQARAASEVRAAELREAIAAAEQHLGEVGQATAMAERNLQALREETARSRRSPSQRQRRN